MKRRLGLLVAAGLLWSGGLLAMHRWEAARGPAEYLSTPPARTVRTLGAGFDNMLANGLYLQFLNYFGKHLFSDHRYRNALPMLELVTDLDPRFEMAYVMGSLALGDNGHIDELAGLWRKGVAANPTSASMAYQAGMALFLFGERDAHRLEAAGYFKRAAALPGGPPEARFLEARMYDMTNRKAMAVRVWQDTYLNAPSREARQVAARALARMGAPLPKI